MPRPRLKFLRSRRWSSPGVRLAYTAKHLSLAIIEYFVHIDADDPPADLVLVRAEVPDTVSLECRFLSRGCRGIGAVHRLLRN